MNLRTLSIAILASLGGAACGTTSQATATRTSAPRSELSDGQILAIYNQVNSFDIETATLGTERSEREAVRDLAKMVKTDHSAVFDLTNKLALELHVDMDLPAAREAAAREHRDTIARLGALSGSEFDRAYLQHEIAFHTAAIRAVRETLMPAASPRVREFMADILPGFEKHLAHTVDVSKQLGL